MTLRIAMIVPPMSNLNGPYSAGPRLGGWLRKLGHQVDPIDLGLELFLRMFSRKGLERLFAAIDPRAIRGESEDVYLERDRYVRVIDEVVAFLQGGDPARAHRIVRGDLLPEGPQFRIETPAARRERFGPAGKVDHARHLATLMLQDLTELFRQTISPLLGLMHYAAVLAEGRPSFEPLAQELARPPNVIETMMLEAAADTIADDVDLVCFSVPFPGMLMGALLTGKWLAAHRPKAARALGGGYPSTELRQLGDPRFFDHVDYLVIDDGEGPLRQICAHLESPGAPLHRTATRQAGKVLWHDHPDGAAPRFRELPAPDYRGYQMNRYVHLLFDGGNALTRIMNEGGWLKLTAAHGCYWKKCTFCDVHLSYIGDFDPLPARDLADQMDELHAQTGLSSFHFTDEAMPPPLMVNLALELLRRERTYQYWGNARFDIGFTPDRCRLLAASGMTAVSGGIEIASDALLPKIDKGISVPQVTKVLQAFSDAGIMTHAYLIYGFPGETRQDTVNSLEILRQLMRAQVLRSAYYHEFVLTAHSPVGRQPELFGLRVKGPQFRGFSNYNLAFERVSVPATDPRLLGRLNAVVDGYARGAGLDADVRSWFDAGELPAPEIPPGHVEELLRQPHPALKVEPRLCWLGGVPRWSHGLLNVSCAGGDIYTGLVPRSLAESLERCHPSGWKQGAPPRPAEVEPGPWLEDFRPRGMVLV